VKSILNITLACLFALVVFLDKSLLSLALILTTFFDFMGIAICLMIIAVPYILIWLLEALLHIVPLNGG